MHLGLGAFHRAHQAWYTQLANDVAQPGEGWGIHSFTGRSPALADALTAQDCRYTLIERASEGDSGQIIESIVRASDGGDGIRWCEAVADPAVGVLTLTVTEAGYCRGADGGLDWALPAVQADLEFLLAPSSEGSRDAAASAHVGADGALSRAAQARDSAAIEHEAASSKRDSATTAPGRIVDGLRARRAAGSGGLAVVSCDNLNGNGAVTRQVVLEFAARLDPALADWIDATVSFVSTMVDRITPATTPLDQQTAFELTGLADAVPVVTEPFSEWILSGAFPAGRPNWGSVGARFVTDIEPYEQRKLWLLNAGHSLLAYRGLLLGHATIAEAMNDASCREALEALWAEAREIVPFDAETVDTALAALRSRFTNARIEHRLEQIARDGALKLPIRVADVIRRRIAAGLPPGSAECGVIASWALFTDVADARSGAPAPSVAEAVLATIAPDLTAHHDVLAQVTQHVSSWQSALASH
ncbi:mannitol dehydrogenase family protein [Subtercola lobariae]|uniref:Mannitol-1-phosphate 5-dehydrogenase n=1 Tax=Subtercola lobariae TaxID=1588641 RepID=A0A917EX90_9MICO|nr:mannitol dehydrogenase family protein [Subtercola lobariae]GGF19532.1 hypothetical protein GCM10011399_11450 [Subtercola lobariae]